MTASSKTKRTALSMQRTLRDIWAQSKAADEPQSRTESKRRPRSPPPTRGAAGQVPSKARKVADPDEPRKRPELPVLSGRKPVDAATVVETPAHEEFRPRREPRVDHLLPALSSRSLGLTWSACRYGVLRHALLDYVPVATMAVETVVPTEAYCAAVSERSVGFGGKAGVLTVLPVAQLLEREVIKEEEEEQQR